VSSKLLLAVSSGRNYILKATLKISGPQGVTFHVQDSALDDNGESQKVSKPHGFHVIYQKLRYLLSVLPRISQYKTLLNIPKFQY